MIFNLNKKYNKYSKETVNLRQQLQEMLDRLSVIVNIKGLFNRNEFNYLKRFQRLLIEDLLYLSFYHKKSGFNRFKEKSNFLIHWILIGYKDPNVIYKGRIPR